MKIVKAPRAVWKTCPHLVSVAVALALAAVAVVLIIVSIWTESDKVAGTALAIGVPALVTAGGAAMAHEVDSCANDRVRVPLPWRTNPEDGRG